MQDDTVGKSGSLSVSQENARLHKEKERDMLPYVFSNLNVTLKLWRYYWLFGRQYLRIKVVAGKATLTTATENIFILYLSTFW